MTPNKPSLNFAAKESHNRPKTTLTNNKNIIDKHQFLLCISSKQNCCKFVAKQISVMKLFTNSECTIILAIRYVDLVLTFLSLRIFF